MAACNDAASPLSPTGTPQAALEASADSGAPSVWIGVPADMIPAGAVAATDGQASGSIVAAAGGAASLSAVGGGATASVLTGPINLIIGCSGVVTGVAFDGSYYYVAEGGYTNSCITQYTEAGARVISKRFPPDFRGLHYVPATGKLVGRTYGGQGGQLYAIDFAAGTSAMLTSFNADCASAGHSQVAADPDGVTFWRWRNAQTCGAGTPSILQRVRIADGVVVASFDGPAHALFNAPVGVSGSEVFVSGQPSSWSPTTVHVYRKANGALSRTFQTTAPASCVGYGFGVAANGSMLGYGTSCAMARVEPLSGGGNNAPIASAGGPYVGTEGAPIALSLAGSDPDADALTYAWDLGDGTIGSGSAPPASHTYADNGTYTISVSVTDAQGESATASTTAQVANVAPTVTGATLPEQLILSGSSVTASVTNVTFTDPAGDADAPYQTAIDCGNGSMAGAGGSCTWSAVGTYTVRITVTDADGGVSAPFTGQVAVVWNWSGFFNPVSDGSLNVVKAGSAIPLRFSLDGYKGLAIFADGSPASAPVSCGSSEGSLLEEIDAAGASELSYDAGGDRYHYTWKTERAWAGTCRELVVRLVDGSEHRVSFQFR